MSRCRGAVLFGLLLFPLSLVYADTDQRFYQIVGPDGRVTTVAVPAEKNTQNNNIDAAVSTKLPAKAEEKKPQPLGQEVAGQEVQADKAQPKTTHAPYGSDVYLDSEVLDSTGFNPEQKQNFYIIPDGSGTRIEQSEAGASDAPSAPERPVLVQRVAIEFDEFEQISSPSELEILLGGSLCLSTDKAKKALDLRKGRWESIYIDKQTMSFVGPRGLLAVYRVGGVGMRSIKLRSYASRDKPPSFVRPYIVLIGESGCAARALIAYFQRKYAATESQHAMVEAELTMHTEEKYLLVVMPDAKSQSGSMAYQLSQYGQLGIKWQP